MAFKQSNLATNDYGVIVVPSVTSEYCDNILAQCYDKGCDQVVTVIDLESKGLALELLPVTSDETIRELTAYMTDEEISSQEVQIKLGQYLGGLYFIWGNPEAGGIYLRHTIIEGVHRFTFGCYRGMVTYTEGDHAGKNRYAINESWNTNGYLFLEELKNIAIFFNIGVHDDPPDFAIMYRDRRHPIITGYVDTNSLQSATWSWYQDATVASATSNPAYTDDWSFVQPFEFQPVPVEPWYDCGWQDISVEQDAGAVYRGTWSGGNEVYDPNEGGSSEDGGGNGGYGTNTDYNTGANPEGMSTDALNSGLITIYNPTKSQVRAFSNFLFGSTITDAIANQMKRLISNPYDYLIFMALCHFHPQIKPTGTTIKFVGVDSLVGSNVVAKQYQKIGDYVLYWDSVKNGFDSYLDYNPFTKVELYLPYVGFVQINADDIAGTSASGVVKLVVRYHVDLLTGSCIVELEIRRGKRIRSGNADSDIDMVRYNWNGNVFQMLPLSSNDFRGLFSAVTQFAGGLASAVAGNPVGGLGSMASAILTQKSSVQKNVPNATSYGYLNVQTPFIIVDRPIQSYPQSAYNGVTHKYEDYQGVPSNQLRKVKEFIGYLETDPNTIWSNSINVLDTEWNEVQELFNTGVWV